MVYLAKENVGVGIKSNLITINNNTKNWTSSLKEKIKNNKILSGAILLLTLFSCINAILIINFFEILKVY